MERSFQAAVQTQNGPDIRPVLRFMLSLFNGKQDRLIAV